MRLVLVLAALSLSACAIKVEAGHGIGASAMVTSYDSAAPGVDTVRGSLLLDSVERRLEAEDLLMQQGPQLHELPEIELIDPLEILQNPGQRLPGPLPGAL